MIRRRHPSAVAPPSAVSAEPPEPLPPAPSSVRGQLDRLEGLERARAADVQVPANSRLAREAIRRAEDELGAAHPHEHLTFRATSVERDQLGMTHVRLARMSDGVPVFGEELVAHFAANGAWAGVSGQVSDLRGALSPAEVTLRPRDALRVALRALGGAPDVPPSVRQVLARNGEGQVRPAYLVECAREDEARPRRMRYVVDAVDGALLSQVNTIDSFGSGRSSPASKARSAPGPTAADFPTGPDWPPSAAASAAPALGIPWNHTVTSSVDLPDDFPLDTVQVDVDALSAHRADLLVRLTSPTGKTVTVFDGASEAAGADLRRSFELADFVQGSPKGTWTLAVTNRGFQNAAKLERWSLRADGLDTQPPPPALDDDRSGYSGEVAVGASRAAEGGWQLKDWSRGGGIETRSAENQEPSNGSVSLRDDDNVWSEPSDPATSPTDVDAQFGAQATYDFYRQFFGRDSIDGKGEKLDSVTHVRSGYDNAFWNGYKMFYGDGDGQEFGPLTSLDIAGHEISHGLTSNTARLNYSGESGALNEGFSDILGKGVQWYAAERNPGVRFSWGVGEDAYTPGQAGDALRYMDDPTRDGHSVDHASNYHPDLDVHFGSGIPDNAFYLLAEGGENRTSQLSVTGIGMEKALQIFGRALMFYLFPAANFSAARDACLRAATDLYGVNGPEVAAVRQAWDAVGVS